MEPAKPDVTAQAGDVPEPAGPLRDDPFPGRSARQRSLNLKITVAVALWVGAYSQLWQVRRLAHL